MDAEKFADKTRSMIEHENTLENTQNCLKQKWVKIITLNHPSSDLIPGKEGFVITK